MDATPPTCAELMKNRIVQQVKAPAALMAPANQSGKKNGPFDLSIAKSARLP